MTAAPRQKSRSGGGARKIGNKKHKCERYRRLVGKPRGPGVAGNKSGAHYVSPRRKRKAVV